MSEISYYTPEMRRAFRSVTPPPNFHVEVAEHSDDKQLFFLEILFDKRLLLNASHDDKMDIYRYLKQVQDALMHEGAVVQVTGKAVK